jgi:hypothetical protein
VGGGRSKRTIGLPKGLTKLIAGKLVEHIHLHGPITLDDVGNVARAASNAVEARVLEWGPYLEVDILQADVDKLVAEKAIMRRVIDDHLQDERQKSYHDWDETGRRSW